VRQQSGRTPNVLPFFAALSKIIFMTNLLKHLLTQGYFAYIDLALAEKYANNDSQAALIAFLSLAVRNGHLCVQIKDSVEPSPSLMDTSENSISSDDLSALEKEIIKGSVHCQDPLVCDQNLFYFRKYWSKETAFVEHVVRLERMQPSLIFPHLEISKVLLHEQAEAIRLACQQTLTIICGGPGTGKTYTAGQMISHFWQAMSQEQRESCRIALAAPTGKAAANLQKSLSRAVGNLDHFKPISAKTLHALLGIKGDGQRKQGVPRYLAADIVIVDECSMIDVDLMTHLFASIKHGARLILLGDKYQLPSVEAGSLFADLMHARGMFSVELKQCMRSELKGILNLAQAIKEGQAQEAVQLLAMEEDGISHLKMDSHALLDYAYSKFPSIVPEDPKSLLESYNAFKVLSSLRKGPLGADEFNAQLHKRTIQKAHADKILVEPIILTSSDANLELFNGESGVLVRKNGSEISVGDYALFPDRKDGSVRKIPGLVLPKFEYAYCLSVHKSQGSEYDHVLFLMPPGTEFFGREVFYTAVTRARRRLEIWGDEQVLEQTVQRSSKRFSGVKERLQQYSDAVT
jgi:exodeoxyribonuclease V alpha subunit